MPSSREYIPFDDDEIRDFAQNILIYATKHHERWEVPAPARFLEEPLGDYAGALSLFKAPNCGKIDIKNKIKAKKVLIKALRVYIQGFIARNPLVTEEDKRQMRLPVYDTEPSKKETPDKIPIMEVIPSGRRQHTANVINPDTHDRKKPAGVKGQAIACHVRKLTDPVSKPGDMGSVFQVSTTRVFTFTEDQIGLVADYAAAYENEAGDRGEWSNVVSVIISG